MEKTDNVTKTILGGGGAVDFLTVQEGLSKTGVQAAQGIVAGTSVNDQEGTPKQTKQGFSRYSPTPRGGVKLEEDVIEEVMPITNIPGEQFNKGLLRTQKDGTISKAA